MTGVGAPGASGNTAIEAQINPLAVLQPGSPLYAEWATAQIGAGSTMDAIQSIGNANTAAFDMAPAISSCQQSATATDPLDNGNDAEIGIGNACTSLIVQQGQNALLRGHGPLGARSRSGEANFGQSCGIRHDGFDRRRRIKRCRLLASRCERHACAGSLRGETNDVFRCHQVGLEDRRSCRSIDLAGFVIQIEVEHHRTVAQFKAAQKKCPSSARPPPTCCEMTGKEELRDPSQAG